MSKPSIYLAGAMNYHRENNEFQSKAVEWRNEFKNEINKQFNTKIKMFDPTLHPLDDYSYDIVAQNHHYVKKMDLMVVNLEYLDKSLGTIWEMATAYNYGKPIITIGKHKWIGHPHLIQMTSFNAKDIKTAAMFIHDAYGV